MAAEKMITSTETTVQEQVVCNALSITAESGPTLSRNQKNNIKKRLKRRAAESMNTFSNENKQTLLCTRKKRIVII
jgi:hypothetical protein